MYNRSLHSTPRFKVTYFDREDDTANIDGTYTPDCSSVVSVSRRRPWTLKGEGQPQTTINWSAMGDVSIAEAKAMLETLKMAIVLAEGLQGEETGQSKAE